MPACHGRMCPRQTGVKLWMEMIDRRPARRRAPGRSPHRSRRGRARGSGRCAAPAPRHRPPALPGTTAPSDSRMIRVGSSSPRLGSISRREKVDSTAGTPSRRGEAAAHRGRARIVGDVALELARRQAEIAVFGRQPVARRGRRRPARRPPGPRRQAQMAESHRPPREPARLRRYPCEPDHRGPDGAVPVMPPATILPSSPRTRLARHSCHPAVRRGPGGPARRRMKGAR